MRDFGHNFLLVKICPDFAIFFGLEGNLSIFLSWFGSFASLWYYLLALAVDLFGLSIVCSVWLFKF